MLTKYGKLIILKEVSKKKYSYGTSLRRVKCKCECGNEKIIFYSALISGSTKSCGCLRKEINGPNSKHKMYGTNIYNIHQGIKQRCDYSKHISYKNYGGRGIKYCHTWKSFEQFYKDMGPTYKKGLSIDRINNNWGYSKENCRWVTQKEQLRNTNSNVRFKYNGEDLCISEWCEKLGLRVGTVFQRINKYGWTIEKALEL